MLRGIGALSRGELAGERMAVAYETKDQEDEHSCFSDNTNADVVGNARRRPDGVPGRLPGHRRPELSDLVATVDPELDAEAAGADRRAAWQLRGVPGTVRAADRRRRRPTRRTGDCSTAHHVDRGPGRRRSPRPPTRSGSRSPSRSERRAADRIDAAARPARVLVAARAVIADRRRSSAPARRAAPDATADDSRRGRARSGGDATGRSTGRRNAFAQPHPDARPRRAPRVRGRQQLLQRQLGDRAGVDRGPRRARPAVQRPVVLVVPLPRRPRRAAADADDPERGLLFRLSVPGAGRHDGACPIRTTATSSRTARSTASRRKAAIAITRPEVAGHVRRRHAVHAARARPTRSSTSAYGPLAADDRWCRRASRRRCSASGCSRRFPTTRSLAHADPDDADGDGISGRANRVLDRDRRRWPRPLRLEGERADGRAAERRRVQRRHRHHELAASRAGLHRRRDRVPGGARRRRAGARRPEARSV